MPTNKRIVVIETGVANIASVLTGFERIGAKPELSKDVELIKEASYAVLPGVGAFGAGMEELKRSEIDSAILYRIENNKPLVCVCLGLQLLAKTSEESPGVKGLGVLDVEVKRFRANEAEPNLRVPQLGWNKVTPDANSKYITEEGFAYFANSFHIAEKPSGFICSTTNYGKDFISTVERGALLGCQFHPELSSAWGHKILSRWLERSLEQ